MGIFGFGKKKVVPKDLEPLPLPPKGMGMEIAHDTPEMSNLRAKIDLIMTQMESMAVKYQTLNEKIDRIERMVQEIYAMAKKA